MPVRFARIGGARVAFTSCLVLPLLTSACALKAPADTRTEDVLAIRELDAQWSKAASRNDLAATVSFYTDDAYLLPPNAPMAIGEKAIRESWAELLRPGVSTSWTITKIEVAQSGDLAYLIGAYKVTVQGPQGQQVEDRGKIMEIWKKQVDGKWKVVADTYNSDMPLPTAPASLAKK